MADRDRASRAVFGVALAAVFALLMGWVLLAGMDEFRAEDPAEVNGRVAGPQYTD